MRTCYIPTSFPGSLLFTPQEAREERPWLGLVTCLPKSGRLQISDWREGRLSVSLPILSVPGMGKHAPVRIARVSKVMSSGPETSKKVYKASESVNVGCCGLCKSTGDTGNLGEISTAKPESTTSVIFCHICFVGHASEDRIILESSGPRSLEVRNHLN